MRKTLTAGLAALFLGGCAMGGVSIDLFPDGSGEIEFGKVEFHLVDTEPEDQRMKGLDLTEKTRMSLSTEKYVFDDLSAVDAGGITFERAVDGDDVMVTISIPIDPAAGWYRRLEITEEKRANARAMLRKKAADRGGEMGMFAPDEEDFEVVVIDLDFPGRVSAQTVLEPAADAPGWLEELAESRWGDGNESAIKIPIDAIVDREIERYVVRFTCSNVAVENVQEKWDRFRANRASTAGSAADPEDE